jgi:phosphorylcholine metabolism protein LicD
MNNISSIKSDLIVCKAIFEKFDVPWSITDGLVLGYGRNGKIIPWDTDLDTGIFVELSNSQWEKLHQSFIENGFILPEQKTDFMYCHREAEFCIGMFHKNGNYYEQFPETTPGLKFIEKASWHNQQQMVHFENDIYPMPNNIQDYLDCRYEKNWETNIIKNAEDFFVYKRGSRNQKDWLTGRCGKNGPLWPKIIKTTENPNEIL